MRVAVIADSTGRNEFEQKVSGLIETRFFVELKEEAWDTDVLFYLLPETDVVNIYLPDTNIPIFVNAVRSTTAQLHGKIIRLNAWPGFLARDTIEIAAPPDKTAIAEDVLRALDWKHTLVPDIPGMISGRIIAMIINEAYFALGEGVSTKADIDLAMRLGTNYPYGPFEWAVKIGLKQIFALLKTLSLTDVIYEPAPAMVKEVNEF